MYQALYRKWRPRTFDEVVGQAHITETLKRQILSGRLSHAYLFVGTRGTGKTTCAKILSKAINCEQPENGNPCNKCPSCRGIDNGSILDVLELDAASNNGVDNVRALREEAVYTPAAVKKRVYIIDEVHMLSTPAFNALLKILEEPPEHLVFILATTEIHKVPATILSRCQRYSFKRIRPENIAERLMFVAGKEAVTLSEEAAILLSRMADGSMRDALSLLDQCASEDVIDLQRVLTAIGLAGSRETVRLLTAVSVSDSAGALQILDDLHAEGKDMVAVLEELLTLVRDVLIIKLIPKGGGGLVSGGYDNTSLDELSEKLTVERLMAAMEMIKDTMRDLRSTGGKLAVELTLMRMCDERLSKDISSALLRIAKLENRTEYDAAVGNPQKATVQASILPKRPDPEVQAGPQGKTQTQPKACGEQAPDVTSALNAGNQTIDTVHDVNGGNKENDTPDGNAACKASGTPPPAAAPVDFWQRILAVIEQKIEIPPYTFLSDKLHTTADLEEDELVIRTKNDFANQMINVAPVIQALKDAAAAIMGRPVKVRITADSGGNNLNTDKLDALSRFGNIKFE
jgi:DNA polymerase-3 subunit gamma/tau